MMTAKWLIILPSHIQLWISIQCYMQPDNDGLAADLAIFRVLLIGY